MAHHATREKLVNAAARGRVAYFSTFVFLR